MMAYSEPLLSLESSMTLQMMSLFTQIMILTVIIPDKETDVWPLLLGQNRYCWDMTFFGRLIVVESR